MIGILIVAHGAFGEALIHSASHVLGKRPLHVRQVERRAFDHQHVRVAARERGGGGQRA